MPRYRFKIFKSDLECSKEIASFKAPLPKSVLLIMAWGVRQLLMFSESNPNSIIATTAAAAAGFVVSCELF